MDHGFTVDYPLPSVLSTEEESGKAGKHVSYKQTFVSKSLVETHRRGTRSVELVVNFGDLWHVDPTTNLVHCRLDMGTTRIPKRGGDVVLYEKSKYNCLLNPRTYRERNPAWELDDAREQPNTNEVWGVEMGNFPKVVGLPTKAPFLNSSTGFSLAEAAQPGKASEFFATPELFELVARHIVGHAESLSNVSRTCQMAFRATSGVFMHWDLTSKDFLFCEWGSQFVENAVAEGRLTAEEGEKASKATAKAFVKVSPVRPDKAVETQVHPYEEALGPLSWELDGIVKMYQALYFTGHLQDDTKTKGIQHLQLHRVPLLGVEGIEAILTSLPKLQTIGIYQCPLIHFGYVSDILDLVTRINEARKEQGDFDMLDLDVFPRYHLGPTKDRVGHYGVVFEDPGDIDTAKAIVAMLVSLVRKARKAGVDLLSPGKGLRLWLEKIPFKFGCLPDIIDAVDNLDHFNEFGEAQAAKIVRQDTRIPSVERLREKMKRTVHYDLLIAMEGKPQLERDLEQQGFLRCGGCDTELLQSFFTREMAWRRPESRLCHGCELSSYLHWEGDSFKAYKKEVARHLFANLRTRDLTSLLKSRGQRNIARAKSMAEQLESDVIDKVVNRLNVVEEERAQCDDLMLNPHRGYSAATNQRAVEKLDAEREKLRTILGLQRRPQRPLAKDWDANKRWYWWQLRLETGVEALYTGCHPAFNAQHFVCH